MLATNAPTVVMLKSGWEPDPEPAEAPPPMLDYWPEAWRNREQVRAWAAGARFRALSLEWTMGWIIDTDIDICPHTGKRLSHGIYLADLLALLVEARLLVDIDRGIPVVINPDENPAPPEQVLARMVPASRAQAYDLHPVRRRSKRAAVVMGGACKRCGAAKAKKNLYCTDCTKVVRREIRERVEA